MKFEKIGFALLAVFVAISTHGIANASNTEIDPNDVTVTQITFQIKNQPGSCGWDMGGDQCEAQAGTGHTVKGHACWNNADGTHTVQCTIE